MLLHEFGEDVVAPLELGLEVFDPAILGVLDGLALAAGVEGGVAVLEELLDSSSTPQDRNYRVINVLGDGHSGVAPGWPPV